MTDFILNHIWTIAIVAFLAMVAAWAIAARGTRAMRDRDKSWYLED